MPRRPRPRPRPVARKKARRRVVIPMTTPREAEGGAPAPVPARARVIPFRSAATLTPGPSAPRVTHADYSYVRREIRRIAIMAAGIVVLLVVLSFIIG